MQTLLAPHAVRTVLYEVRCPSLQGDPAACASCAERCAPPCAEAVVLYEEACAELGWEPDAGRLEAMRAASDAGLAALDARVKDAQENLGDVEVRDALAAKAEHLCRIGAPADRAGSRRQAGRTALPWSPGTQLITRECRGCFTQPAASDLPTCSAHSFLFWCHAKAAARRGA